MRGGAQRLTEPAGPGRAREIIYTADQYDAATFERWNIENKVVPDEEFEAQTIAFAERLASGPTLAYSAGKRMVRAYLDGGTRAADKIVDKIAPRSLIARTCARVDGLLQYVPREFRNKVVFRGR